MEENFNTTLTGKFFTYRDEVYYAEKYLELLWENFFMFKCGVKIGKIDNGEFLPNFYAGTHF